MRALLHRLLCHLDLHDAATVQWGVFAGGARCRHCLKITRLPRAWHLTGWGGDA